MAQSNAPKRTDTWKMDFRTGERFRIKNHVFVVAAVSKRGLVIRRERPKETAEISN